MDIQLYDKNKYIQTIHLLGKRMVPLDRNVDFNRKEVQIEKFCGGVIPVVGMLTSSVVDPQPGKARNYKLYNWYLLILAQIRSIKRV